MDGRRKRAAWSNDGWKRWSWSTRSNDGWKRRRKTWSTNDERKGAAWSNDGRRTIPTSTSWTWWSYASSSRSRTDGLWWHERQSLSDAWATNGWTWNGRAEGWRSSKLWRARNERTTRSSTSTKLWRRTRCGSRTKGWGWNATTTTFWSTTLSFSSATTGATSTTAAPQNFLRNTPSTTHSYPCSNQTILHQPCT